jgi:hypothetical protein
VYYGAKPPDGFRDNERKSPPSNAFENCLQNENVSGNSVHISLNFAAENNLSKEHLQQIAAEYMEQIGFGKQPYWVYQHNDAGDKHIHIVSVKVRPDGSRIDMQAHK